ncbi:hypothetical protein AAXE64_27230 [Priestia megaterium]
MPLSLFGDKTEEEKQKELKLGLAALAGSGIGWQAGSLASLPLDARHQNKLTEEALQLTKDKEDALEHWRTLIKIERGQLSFDDLPEADRDFYRKEYAENIDDLKALARNPYELKRSMDDLKQGTVKPLFGKLPKATMRGDFPEKVRHPYSRMLPGIGGILGGIGAEVAMNQFLEKEDEE